MSSHQSEREELRTKFAAFVETGDRALRDELVAAHIGLAEYLARRFANRGESLDDLIQVASIGLVKAVDRFDPSRGVAFSTYATHTIIGELKRHFRDRGWAVRAPRRMQELYLRLSDVIGTLSQQLGRSPTIGDLAAEVKVSEEEVLEALEAGQAYRFASLDTGSPGDGADGTADSLLDRLGDEDAELDTAESRALLAPLLATLSSRERFIVRLRFFEGLTQLEIAGRLGISQMHVSRLLAGSVSQLRSASESSGSGRPASEDARFEGDSG